MNTVTLHEEKDLYNLEILYTFVLDYQGEKFRYRERHPDHRPLDPREKRQMAHRAAVNLKRFIHPETTALLE